MCAVGCPGRRGGRRPPVRSTAGRGRPSASPRSAPAAAPPGPPIDPAPSTITTAGISGCRARIAAHAPSSAATIGALIGPPARRSTGADTSASPLRPPVPARSPGHLDRLDDPPDPRAAQRRPVPVHEPAILDATGRRAARWRTRRNTRRSGPPRRRTARPGRGRCSVAWCWCWCSWWPPGRLGLGLSARPRGVAGCCPPPERSIGAVPSARAAPERRRSPLPAALARPCLPIAARTHRGDAVY